jgi:hypothetical protein
LWRHTCREGWYVWYTIILTGTCGTGSLPGNVINGGCCEEKPALEDRYITCMTPQPVKSINNCIMYYPSLPSTSRDSLFLQIIDSFLKDPSANEERLL